MYSKIKITGVIEVVTGMHIGGSSAFSAIGAVDSPVVKDPLSGLPLLPDTVCLYIPFSELLYTLQRTEYLRIWYRHCDLGNHFQSELQF